MNVMIVSAVFPPEPVVSSRTSAQIAQGLLDRGHRVKVITSFPSRPAGKLYPGYTRKLFQRQQDANGSDLIRCFAVLSSESTMVSRFLENISFGVTGGLAALLVQKPDVIYSNTWPIFATGFLALVARMRSIPIAISVKDMYPEQLIAQHRIKIDSWVARLMYWVEKRLARYADEIILPSEYLADLYQQTREVPPDRLHVVPDWADSESITVDDHDAPLVRARHAIPQEAFAAIYGGNIAFAAGVETLVESFSSLEDLQDAHLVIAGEGTSADSCRQIARESGNPRIHFHAPWPRSENSMVLSAADVLILPTRGTVSLAAMPSKLISYMLAARPIIALALPQSDLAQTIKKADCGWVIQPDAPELLAATIREVRALPLAERVRRGLAGRDYAMNHLTREVCLPQVIELLEQTAFGGLPTAQSRSDSAGSDKTDD